MYLLGGDIAYAVPPSQNIGGDESDSRTGGGGAAGNFHLLGGNIGGDTSLIIGGTFASLSPLKFFLGGTRPPCP